MCGLKIVQRWQPNKRREVFHFGMQDTLALLSAAGI